MKQKGSARFSLDTTDWKKIGKGALIALGGALLTYVASILSLIDIGSTWTPILVGMLGVLINAGWKFIENHQ